MRYRPPTQHLFAAVHLMPFYAGYDMQDPASSGYISRWTSLVRNATQRSMGSPGLAGIEIFPGWGTDGDPRAAEEARVGIKYGGVVIARFYKPAVGEPGSGATVITQHAAGPEGFVVTVAAPLMPEDAGRR